MHPGLPPEATPFGRRLYEGGFAKKKASNMLDQCKISDEERGKKDNKPRQGWQKQQEKGSGKGGKGVQKKQHQKTSNKGKQKGKGKPGKRDKVKSAKGPKRNASCVQRSMSNAAEKAHDRDSFNPDP
eukprot:957242-Pelagomonas_calceolata.AAC.1